MLSISNAPFEIIDSVANLPRARKNQYAAFIREEGVLAIWADKVEDIVPSASKLEERLFTFLVVREAGGMSNSSTMSDLKKEVGEMPTLENVEDPERARFEATRKQRPLVFISPVVHGLAIGLVMVLLSLGIRKSSC